MSRVTLVLGGARSGKSRYAEGLSATYGPKTYIATAQPLDDEMRQRIADHQARRGEGWVTVEAPRDLAGALDAVTAGFVLVDCVTLWLSNLLLQDRDLAAEVEALCRVLERIPARVVLVSNEVGLGIVPDNAMARRFRDAQGLANQRLAVVADEVVFVAAGLPLTLKSLGR